MINYNPDILNCLANLSNDEVFTPPSVVNQMLDLLPEDLWHNPKATFLDPFTKSGVFLREITKRLNEGLKDLIPGTQERINHILQKQVFGIAITELTSLMARRSVYCCKRADSAKSIATCFDDEQGNIIYERVKHSFINGKCEFCGANKDTYANEDGKENYAYQFIHTYDAKKFFKNMKFDVIIGNPPYQLADGGGTGDSAKPLYHLFIQQAKKLQPKYLSMIVPSRWMKGGKGLSSFREEMMADTRIKYMYDFEDANECFTGLHIDGGVCFFLWDNSYNGKVEYHYKSYDGATSVSSRYLKTDFSDTVIRDYRQISILSKVFNKTKESFSEIVSTRNPFGFGADFFNSANNESKIYGISQQNLIKIYGVKGKKGGAKRTSGYIKKDTVLYNKDKIGLFKLFFSKAYMTTSTVPPEIIIGEPNEICTETFLLIGGFKNMQYAKNCLSYIKTKFFRAILFYNRHSLNISKESFKSIPLQDFSKPWTDEELYKKYDLNKEEIDFIENMIKPME